MKRFALPKTSLVRKNREFEQIYKQGKRVYGDGFILVHRQNDFGWNRLGISINGKIKGSVKRNRIKRIIRESFRLNRERYPQGADTVFVVRVGFALNSPSAVTEAVIRSLSATKRPNES